ncbi:MAG: SHOCT domain-containing protein [Actinomycetota bacterium]
MAPPQPVAAAPTAPAPPAPAPAAPDDDRYEQLRQAKELLDSGILTEEEFAAEKAKILGN